MHLNRDQKIAIEKVRAAGFNPIQALILTNRYQGKSIAVVSVSAIKEDIRYNLRVIVNQTTSEITLCDELATYIDWQKSTDATRVSGCVVKDVVRTNQTKLLVGDNV